MGNPTPTQTPQGATGSPVPPVSGTDAIVYWLQQIFQALTTFFGRGGALPQVIYFNILVAGTFQQLPALLVEKGIIQNLSATDTVTICSSANSASGAGIILNAASAAGNGGGSHPVGNIDLSKLFVTCSTNNNQKIAIYIEQ